jgi:hypothetical protein
MRFQTISLTALIMGSGRVNLLSGRIRRYRVGFGSATRCAPVNPLVRAGRVRVVRPAGLRRIRPEADFQLRNSFSFSNLFCKLQINLNSNQI